MKNNTTATKQQLEQALDRLEEFEGNILNPNDHDYHSILTTPVEEAEDSNFILMDSEGEFVEVFPVDGEIYWHELKGDDPVHLDITEHVTIMSYKADLLLREDSNVGDVLLNLIEVGQREIERRMA